VVFHNKSCKPLYQFSKERKGEKMRFFRNGYVCFNHIARFSKANTHPSKNIYFVRMNDGGWGYVPPFASGIYFPKEYIGKKVRFKVEIVGDEKR